MLEAGVRASVINELLVNGRPLSKLIKIKKGNKVDGTPRAVIEKSVFDRITATFKPEKVKGWFW